MNDRKSAVSAADIHRRTVELVGAGRRAEALALIDPEAIDHRGGALGDRHGRGAWGEKWEQMWEGLQDVSLTIAQNVSSGEFSVNRYLFRATDTASGRRLEITGLDMVRVRDGKLVEHWALVDSAAMKHQLGAGAQA